VTESGLRARARRPHSSWRRWRLRARRWRRPRLPQAFSVASEREWRPPREGGSGTQPAGQHQRVAAQTRASASLRKLSTPSHGRQARACPPRRRRQASPPSSCNHRARRDEQERRLRPARRRGPQAPASRGPTRSPFRPYSVAAIRARPGRHCIGARTRREGGPRDLLIGRLMIVEWPASSSGSVAELAFH